MTRAMILSIGLFLATTTKASTSIRCETTFITDQRPVTTELLNSFSSWQNRESRLKMSEEQLKGTVFIFVDATPAETQWVNRILGHRGPSRALFLKRTPEAPQQGLAEALKSILDEVHLNGPLKNSIKDVIVFNAGENKEIHSRLGIRFIQFSAGNSLIQFMNVMGWPRSRADDAASIYSRQGEYGLKAEGFSQNEIDALKKFFGE